MHRVFLGLGSNLGDRLRHLTRAVEAADRLEKTRVRAASSVYETEPIGTVRQPDFLNAAIELETSLPPMALFSSIKSIEQQLGRKQTERWGPREIDLDILYYGSLIVKGSSLLIPHPELYHRKFVLLPLNEIGGDFIDPVTHCTIQALLEQCQDASSVVLIHDLLQPGARG